MSGHSLLRRTAVRMLPARVREQRAEARRIEREQAAELKRVERERETERKRVERIAERRRDLLAADSTLRTVTVEEYSLYGRVVDSLPAGEAAAHNLRLVAAAAERAGVDYFLVSERSAARHVIAVRHADRRTLLDSVRELYRGTALYAARAGREVDYGTAALYADGALPKKLKRAGTMRFGEILLGPAGQVLAGLEAGCEVEFWREGAEILEWENAADRIRRLRVQAPGDVFVDALVAPRANAVSDVLPAGSCRAEARRTVRGRSYPVPVDFDRPELLAPDFPIDVVYTWVDGSDPVLSEKREAHRPGGARTINERETGAARYTSRDELKYSLRSLEMYADFVRHVYIVTDGQTPHWLDPDAEGVTVIDHKEIFADTDALPVFNSHAIGTQLHRIPGLSEHYLYFNDDVFMGRPVPASQFFHGNGIAQIPFSPAQLGLGAPHPDDPAPNSAGKNVRRLLAESHGTFTTHKFKHTPHPQIRSVMRDIEERFPDEVRRTSRSRFRSPQDIAMGASFHHHYAYLTGRAVPGEYELRYVDIGAPDADERLRELSETRGFDFFCLNDVVVSTRPAEEVNAWLHAFLENYYPFPSRYERLPEAAEQLPARPTVLPRQSTGTHDADAVSRSV